MMKINDLNSELKLKKVPKPKDDPVAAETENAIAPDADEIIVARGVNSSTFRRGKGRYESSFYDRPVHFSKKGEAYERIDNTLICAEDGCAFDNCTHPFHTHFFHRDDTDALFSLEKDSRRLTVSVQKKFGLAAEHPAAVETEGRLTYNDVIPETDYSSELTADGVKVGITVKTPDTSDRYAFRMSGDGLSVVCNEADNSVQLFADPSEEPVFEITAPFLTDAAGAYAECVSFEVVTDRNGDTVMTLIPDHGWMLAKEREYPVKLEWAVRCADHGYEAFRFDGKVLSADGRIAVGADDVHFRMRLPEMRPGLITRSVRALFRCVSVPVAEGKSYALVLKRFRNGEAPTTIGYCAVREGQEEYGFDITSEYGKPDPCEYALQLCSMKKGELVGVTDSSVAVLQVGGNDAIRTFAVTETDGTADEDSSATGESGNIGSIGTYNVDHTTGKLNMEIGDFEWAGNRMPVRITRAYKGQHAAQHYNSWKGVSLMFGNMLIGHGWHMNLMQSMIYTGSQSVDGKYRDTYTYINEAGEESVFARCECESGTACYNIYEEAGTGYTYDAAKGELKKGDETCRFVSGRLVGVRDRFGNEMNINFGNGKITSVTDGIGRAFTFGYDGNYLISVTAPDGSEVTYGYCNGKLRCETHPNGQKISYIYDPTSGMPKAITVSGGGIEAVTTKFSISGGRINEIVTSVNGQDAKTNTKIESDGSGRQVVVTETDSDGNDADAIKKISVYFPTEPDKNYTYFEAGDDNRISLADAASDGVILPYSEPGPEIGDLRCENLLNNHNFKRAIMGYGINMLGWYTNMNDDTRSIQYDTAEGMPGLYSAYLLSLNKTDKACGMWQNVTLEADTPYVFSCYLRLDRGNSDTSRGVYLMVKKENSGEVIARSKMISRRDGFARVVLPFKIKDAGLYSVGIYIDGNIKAKAIAPQLEEGNMLSPYNYISGGDAVKPVTGSISCETGTDTPAAVINVPSAKDARETFTLSGFVKAEATGSVTGIHAELRAVIKYTMTSEERKQGDEAPSETYSVPVYRNGQFALVQFCKQKFRYIDHIEIYCCNLATPYTLNFSNLQLVRNEYATGLTEEDFGSPYDDSEDVIPAEKSSTDSSPTDDIETISFDEALDGYGNTLTGTSFENGEPGTIYTGSVYGGSGQSAGNNKTKEIDARGNVTLYRYDEVTSKPAAVTDRCGNETTYAYDSAGRVKKVTAPIGSTVQYEYNSYDDMTGIVRGDGQGYGMEYDPYRNLTGIGIRGGADLAKYQYRSGSNRLKSVKYANGCEQLFTYDRFGNIRGELWKKGTVTEANYRYFYNASNQHIKTLDIIGKKLYNINRVGNNITSTEEYDVANIDTSTYAASGLTLVGTMYYSFDSNGKQFRKKFVSADGTEQKYVYEYRDDKNVAVQLPGGAISQAKNDSFGRKVFDELQLGTGFVSRKFDYIEGAITDAHKSNGKVKSPATTQLVSRITLSDGRTVSYEYDAEERITKVTDSLEGTTEYTYDALGQLLTEKVNGTVKNSMSYDGYGNIRTKNGKAYTYGNSVWKDLLTSYGGQAISHDAQGNPTSYLGHTLTWEKGRQLKSFDSNAYTYNASGIRMTKTVGGVKHTYTLDGTKIIREVWGGNTLFPLYGVDDSVCGINYNGSYYYFAKNLQGDIIAIVDKDAKTVARYSYDAWGVPTVVSDSSGRSIATINPFRYRGYYYDAEIGMYYLQSRYYNPVVGRFVNADDAKIIQYSNELISLIYFGYCKNNPVNYTDSAGKAAAAIAIGGGAIALAELIKLLLIFVGVTIVFLILIAPSFQRLLINGVNRIISYARSLTAELERAISIALEKAKTRPPVNRTEIHHIVAQNSNCAYNVASRKILKELNIGINSDYNLVAIKYRFHRRLHTYMYYKGVHDMLEPVRDYRWKVIVALTTIKIGLLVNNATCP